MTGKDPAHTEGLQYRTTRSAGCHRCFSFFLTHRVNSECRWKRRNNYLQLTKGLQLGWQQFPGHLTDGCIWNSHSIKEMISLGGRAAEGCKQWALKGRLVCWGQGWLSLTWSEIRHQIQISHSYTGWSSLWDKWNMIAGTYVGEGKRKTSVTILSHSISKPWDKSFAWDSKTFGIHNQLPHSTIQYNAVSNSNPFLSLATFPIRRTSWVNQ